MNPKLARRFFAPFQFILECFVRIQRNWMKNRADMFCLGVFLGRECYHPSVGNQSRINSERRAERKGGNITRT